MGASRRHVPQGSHAVLDRVGYGSGGGEGGREPQSAEESPFPPGVAEVTVVLLLDVHVARATPDRPVAEPAPGSGVPPARSWSGSAWHTAHPPPRWRYPRQTVPPRTSDRTHHRTR